MFDAVALNAILLNFPDLTILDEDFLYSVLRYAYELGYKDGRDTTIEIFKSARKQEES